MKLELDTPRRTAMILDPHPLCHAALTAPLQRLDVVVVATARSAAAALPQLREHRPSLLVTEIDLPEGREAALRLIRESRCDDPKLTVVVVAACDDRSVIDAAFDHGASTYVLKTADPPVVETALRLAFEQSLYMAGPRRDSFAELRRREPHGLTRRELEILRVVSEGRSNREAAELLFVTDQTVKFHLANVYRKLGVRSRGEAARWARENGLIDPTGMEEAASPEPVDDILAATFPGLRVVPPVADEPKERRW